MLNKLPPDVYAQIKQRMASGNYTSEADVLRQAMRALRVHDQELAAIQMGIDDMESGRVRAFEDVDTEICQDSGFSRDR